MPAAPNESALADTETPESGPLRRCLVERQSLPRETMLRFVLSPDSAVVFDVAATLPGRGMWLSAAGVVIDTAVKRGVFARVAKAPVKLPPALPQIVATALRTRITELLGLARRGGGAISGFEKAREWLAQGKAGLVVQANDGSAEERARFTGGREIPVVTPLDAAALGKIFGRDHAVHAVVGPGRLARMIGIEAARLAGVTGVAGEAATGQTARPQS